MMSWLIVLALQTPDPCTLTTLRLPSTALTEDGVRSRAKQLWGVDYIVRSDWHGDSRYSIKAIGHYIYPIPATFGFGPIAPRKTEDILGTNDTGSWRKAWNAAMIKWCKSGGQVIP